MSRVQSMSCAGQGAEVAGRDDRSLVAAVARTENSAANALLGEDEAFRGAVAMALCAARTDCNVLVVGETGTGKELVARAIHDASPCASGAMVAVNCGAIPRELIGSELFGHERGAFTGATAARDGVFVQASGGTLFLDELGELPIEQQPHLLRVLETRRVRRIGGTREQPVDVRLVAATNRIDNLGTPDSPLRLDLYHRLATVVVRLPPLRERPSDVPILVRAFMNELRPALGERTIRSSTMHALCDHAWPGNVRELRQAVRRAMTLCPDELTLDHLLPHVASDGERAARHGRASERLPRKRRRPRICPGTTVSLRPIDIIIRDAMLDAVERTSSMRSAAESLGMAKSTFFDWAERLGIAIE